MEKGEFEALVIRLARSAARRPGTYTLAVLAVAALGFGILGVALSFAVVPAVALIGAGVLLAAKGGLAFLLLAQAGKAGDPVRVGTEHPDPGTSAAAELERRRSDGGRQIDSSMVEE